MIEAEGLTKFYGSVPAIRDVSFQVDKGEVVGFLGPNGAGKSTTIRILTAFMPATAGTAKIEGFDCFENSLEVRRRVGYLPENVAFYGIMTVRRYLRYAAGVKGVERGKVEREIDRVVEQCRLKQVEGRVIAHLSKGYRQRVGLAQALINDPPILILDEPSIGLDPTQIVEIRNLVRDLRDRHTILLSSHILPEVAQICQRVIIINKGRIVATDTPANLTGQLQKSSRVAVTVRGSAPALTATLEGIEGVQRVEAIPEQEGSLIVETDRSRDLRPEIARKIIESNLDLLEIKSVDLSLEDIFMHLVTDETSEPAEDEEEAA